MQRPSSPPRSLLRAFVPALSTAAVALVGVLVTVVHPRPAVPASAAFPVLPAEGALAYDVRDADTGNLIPCKLTFVGVSGTPRPAFTRFDIGRQEGDAILAYDRLMSSTGSGVARVPDGTYDVYVSRGPEWDLHVARKLVVSEKKGVQLAARLHHVVDTGGWVSADFHVHASMSTDSHVPMHDRIFEFVSEGVDLITSTDHNVVADYAPLIKQLGVGQWIGSIVGDELTTNGWGHHGAFPLPQILEKAGHGATLVHGRNAQTIFADVRKNAPEAIIDVHHPRIDNEIGYFNTSRFDAATDEAKPGFSFDFDALEVLNGYQDTERKSVDRVIEDWFRLLQHGHIVTATGNSDSHHLDLNIGGYPRNFVRIADDRPSVVKPADVARAVRGHHSFLTTAPFVLLSVDGVEVGGIAPATSGHVRADVEVRAPDWVSVSRVILIQSGREVKRWTLGPKSPAGPRGVRFHESIDLDVPTDEWVVARVEGDEPLAPVVGDRVRDDVRPFALTNPVFLDRNGNGVFDAPLGASSAGRSPAKPSR